MRRKCLKKPEPMDGLRILARVIVHHFEMQREQSHFTANNSDKNGKDQIFRGKKEVGNG
jgi:hypothetical protein